MSTTKATVTRDDVQAFCDACVSLRATWEHYRTLYEQSVRRSRLLRKVAPIIFGDIREMMVEHLVLKISAITDPPESFGRKNLTIKFLLAYCDFSTAPQKFEKLKQISERIHEFRDIILPARNRYISHLDVEAIRDGDALGGAEDEKWKEFWIDLQDFLHILYDHYISANFYLNNISGMSDAASLVKALKESKYFEALLDDAQTTQRASEVAQGSPFYDA